MVGKAAEYNQAAGATMFRLRAIRFVIALIFSGCSAASANDSSAELSIGGLQFTRSPYIEMRSEDLKISLDRVSVRYEFVNTSSSAVTVTVGFPLPDIDLSEGDNVAFPSNDPLNFVDFETKVDGNPIKFNIDQRAFVGDRDVTAQLRELKIPLLPLGSQQFRPQDLSPTAQGKLASEGLLMPAGSNERGKPLYSPGWVVKTTVYREQMFPPDKPVIVEHTYRPSIGASADTILKKALRQDKAMASEFERYRREYCVSEQFLKDLDKMAGSLRNNDARIQERRISYVLKTGANWARPIRNFHLSIEKGANAIVSYCPGKLTPSDKLALDASATDFTPNRDLKLLFVGRF